MSEPESLDACCTALHAESSILYSDLNHSMVHLRTFLPRTLTRRIAQHLQTARRQTRQSLFLHHARLAIRSVPHCRHARVPLFNRSRIVGIVPECFTLFGSRDVDALQVAHEATAGDSSEQWAEEWQACANDPKSDFDEWVICEWCCIVYKSRDISIQSLVRG